MWLIDTGAAPSVLSFKVYNSFPARVKFSLGSANFAIALNMVNKQRLIVRDML